MHALGTDARDENFAIGAGFTNPLHVLNALVRAEQGSFGSGAAHKIAAEGNGVQFLNIVENFRFVEIAFVIETASKGRKDTLYFHCRLRRKSLPVHKHRQALIRTRTYRAMNVI